MKYFTTILIAFTLSGYCFAQYTIDPGYIVLPEQDIISSAVSMPVSTNKQDVKYIGMGKTGVANGRKINAMMYNPALLSRSRFSVDAVNVNLSIPPATYEAANFLGTHLEEFKDALSLKEVWNGIENFNNAEDINQQLDAVKKIQDGLKFPKELFEQVIGTPDNPTIHGVRTTPSFAFQFGNFGFTLYGEGRSNFQVIQSPVLDQLLSVKIPESLDNSQQIAEAVLSLQGILQPIAEGSAFTDALPVAYTVSFIDVVGAVGYAYNFTPQLSIGTNLKVVHRRFSAKKLLLEQYKEILNILKQVSEPVRYRIYF